MSRWSNIYPYEMRRAETDGQIVKIPLVDHLLDDANFIEHGTRSDAVTRAKEVLKREWQEIAQWQLDNVQSLNGAEISIRLTSVVDSVVSALARFAWKKSKAPEGAWRLSSVFALGGYGRGEMNPSSDLDIIVLHEPNQCPQWLTDANGEFNTLLWDAGFSVGSSMRSLHELEHIMKHDFVTATAVLEHRRVIGTADLEHELYEILERFRKKRGKAFLQYKIEEIMQRRNELGASVFLLEPNLKTNPGCLRDIQFLLNAAYIVFGGRNLHALQELSSVSNEDVEAIIEANTHILQIRCLQHFHHNTRQDKFELRDQVRVAKQLGYRGLSRLREVEVMMREHYHKILSVHLMVELLLSYLRNNGYLGRKITLIKTRRNISTYFASIAGQVYGRDRALWQRSDLMLMIMDIFLIAHRKNLKISKELQGDIRAHLPQMKEEDRHCPEIAQKFLQLLGDYGHVQETMEDMHNCGFLGHYMPEFSNISCLMQFDSYHQYTVDQHTLFALGNLDRVHRGEDEGLPGMTQILASIKRKDLLNLGLLLHDVGKYMGRGHVPRGAMMVGEIAKRMHLNEEEKDLVYFLVEKHVRMSDSSRMRDISDEEF
ncbi:MAG: nucleotidyltransferase domain-containing protein, partial [Planctomycetes bacterium]|nr:nucleotidyltransferase domain-containing protein [Planctomycetota bacterium]